MDLVVVNVFTVLASKFVAPVCVGIGHSFLGNFNQEGANHYR